MIEITGKYNTAKVFTDTADKSTTAQIESLLNQPFIEGSKVRMMSDCHAGKGCVVGTTMTITDKVVPNLVGVDIGCGILTVQLKETRIDLPKFDSVLHEVLPCGFDRHKEPIVDFDLSGLVATVDVHVAACSIASLGGGNHFVEIDKDDHGILYLTIHTGSRHLGTEVCDYYQKLAYKKLQNVDPGKSGTYKQLAPTLIENLKKEGRESEIESVLNDLKNKLHLPETMDIPYELAYLEGEDLDNYLNDMRIAQAYAKLNRQTIAKRLLKYAKLHAVDEFDTIHNYIDLDNVILRKGSISAQHGEKSIIPMNMRDGSLICIGKGNPDWNYSAPHGAGRVMSRTEAKSCLGMKEFKESMQGIYSTSISKETIDEAPMVYKPMDEIVRNIQDTVEIVNIIKPIYNFKAGGK